jgi:peptide/nickel transport system permease protein
VSKEHFVSEAPFDPHSIERMTEGQEKYYMASRRKLIWWKLKRHKLAVWCGLILFLMYGTTLISEWIAPYYYQTRHSEFIYSPPQRLHLFHEGKFIGPFVYGNDTRLNMETLGREYVPNPEKVHKLRFFCSGDSYKFWGRIPSDFHFICPAEGTTLFLLGTDRLGRDLFSRITYGARISLLIGLGGITVSLFLGLFFGGLAGYYGGWVDSVVQRLTEIIRSFPELPLWMALSAILPVTWSPLLIFFGITVILALLARRRLLHGSSINGRPPKQNHQASPASRLHQPYHCLGHTLDPRDDPWRNRIVISRTGLTSSYHQLGGVIK